VTSYIRDTVKQMQGYTPGEQPQDKRYIKLNTNENPYPPSPQVLAAVRAATNEDLRLYPDPVAEKLREKAAAVYGLRKENVLVGNGSDELLAILLHACVGTGDRVAYPVPTYSLYDTLVTIGEGEPVRIPFLDDFSLPQVLFTTAARLTFLCNPNSPSGTLTPIERIAELARCVSGILVVDEAYVDFAEETALPLLPQHPHLVILRTFSKSFSLAGMRIGLALGHGDLIAELMKVKDSYNLNRLSTVAAIAALEDYDWMQQNVKRIKATRFRLIQGLIELGFLVCPSQANFVLARKKGEKLEPLYLGLKEKGILVRYFSSPELHDSIRITVGTDEEIVALLRELKALTV